MEISEFRRVQAIASDIQSAQSLVVEQLCNSQNDNMIAHKMLRHRKIMVFTKKKEIFCFNRFSML